MCSIGSIIDANKGLGPGFDFLRVALAIGVVFVHAETVATGANYTGSRVMWLPEYAILAMFFALSGFLITGSAQRLSLANFIINRGMRIFPALVIEVVLSAFVLGAMFTELPLRAYYSHPQTYHYLTNIFGWINYRLPGVFLHNPKPGVNWSLWTVPYEFGCYAIMAALMIFKLLKRRKLIMLIAAIFLVIGIAATELDLGSVATLVFAGPGSKLLISFLLGISGYLYRDRLPYSWSIFAGCVVFCLILASMRPVPWMTQALLNLTLIPVVIYITVFIGATRIPRLPIYGRGDYSYGIYLYGNPIQQAVRAAIPWTGTSWLNLAFSVPLITIFAIFSWHCLEKPTLRLRRRFSFVARVRGVEGAGESNVGAPPSPDQ